MDIGVNITAKNKEQRDMLHKSIIKAIKHSFDLTGVSNMLYKDSGGKKGTDFSGCSIRVIDIHTKTDYKDKIK
tara:strand:- start:352 stop:570 length:219 start_codon:yes stop_codon:yes gene_type:complete